MYGHTVVSFRKLQPHSSMAVRWLELLEDFNFDVIHRPGKQLVADVVSRTPAILEPPSDDNRYEDRPVVELVVNLGSARYAIMPE